MNNIHIVQFFFPFVPGIIALKNAGALSWHLKL